MKSVSIKIQINKGLEPVSYDTQNSPYLVESIGAVPYQGILQAVKEFQSIDISKLNCQFPYPQLFIATNYILVFTETAIYEYVGYLQKKIGNLTAGTTWSMADFTLFLYFTNGQQAVIRDPATGNFRLAPELPFGTWVCNYNGQALIGSPNTPASGNI